ncbi:transposase [Grimontia sp. AD028]|nr:transposase [Grimontia sp. AD028]
MHLAIDAGTHEVISVVVSWESVGDKEALPTLLNPLRRKIGQVSGGVAYDTKSCPQVLRRKAFKPTIPPRSNTGLWEDGHPRNDAVHALKAGALSQWKRENNCHQRSLSETAMYRFKQLVSPKLALRDYNAQVGEALANVKAMNKVIRLGMPKSYRVE